MRTLILEFDADRDTSSIIPLPPADLSAESTAQLTTYGDWARLFWWCHYGLHARWVRRNMPTA